MTLVDANFTFSRFCTPVRFLKRTFINSAFPQIFLAGINPGDAPERYLGGCKVLIGQLQAIGRAVKINEKNSAAAPWTDRRLVKLIHGRRMLCVQLSSRDKLLGDVRGGVTLGIRQSQGQQNHHGQSKLPIAQDGIEGASNKKG